MSDKVQSRRRGWGRWWRRWSKRSSLLFLSQTVLVLVQTGALVYSVHLLREQTKDIENTKSNRSADFIFRFDERLAKSPFSELALAIQRNQPILKAHGGKFSEDDLQGYLDLWESINPEYVAGLISKEMAYNSYSNDIQKAYDNPEVQTFVKESQKESPEFYTGFENLAKDMKAMQANANQFQPTTKHSAT